MSLKHRQRSALRVLILLVVGSVFVYLLLPRHDIELSRDEGESRAEILSHVPIGSPAEAARSTMERSGFDCSFLPYEGGEVDALRCMRDRVLWPLVGWVVVFYLEDGSVAEVAVNYSTDPMP